jgi:hypothetical protein
VTTCIAPCIASLTYSWAPSPCSCLALPGPRVWCPTPTCRATRACQWTRPCPRQIRHDQTPHDQTRPGQTRPSPMGRRPTPPSTRASRAAAGVAAPRSLTHPCPTCRDAPRACARGASPTSTSTTPPGRTRSGSAASGAAPSPSSVKRARAPAPTAATRSTRTTRGARCRWPSTTRIARCRAARGMPPARAGVAAPFRFATSAGTRCRAAIDATSAPPPTPCAAARAASSRARYLCSGTPTGRPVSAARTAAAPPGEHRDRQATFASPRQCASSGLAWPRCATRSKTSRTSPTGRPPRRCRPCTPPTDDAEATTSGD